MPGPAQPCVSDLTSSSPQPSGPLCCCPRSQQGQAGGFECLVCAPTRGSETGTRAKPEPGCGPACHGAGAGVDGLNPEPVGGVEPPSLSHFSSAQLSLSPCRTWTFLFASSCWASTCWTRTSRPSSVPSHQYLPVLSAPLVMSVPFPSEGEDQSARGRPAEGPKAHMGGSEQAMQPGEWGCRGSRETGLAAGLPHVRGAGPRAGAGAA